LTICVIVETIVSNIIVTVYERWEGRRLRSASLIANSAHTRSGVLVSFSALAGLVLIRFGYVLLDPIISLGVEVTIAWGGYQIFKSTAPVLIDAALVPCRTIDVVCMGFLIYSFLSGSKSTIPLKKYEDYCTAYGGR
jgi:divalent metal cation (Fe/Co/Zn/Cd) transporter